MSKWTEHKIYIYLALFFGLLFVFLTPPFQSPDEDSHFKKAYVISKGQILPKKVDNKLTYKLPQNMNIYIYEQLAKMGKRNEKYSYENYYLDQTLRVDYGEQKYYEFSTVGCPLIAHIIPSIGIMVGNISSHIILEGDGSAPASYLVYFARLACLLFYVIVCYFAIKRTPIYKKTMMLVSLLPMSLFIGSMVSYDGLFISLSLFLISNICSI